MSGAIGKPDPAELARLEAAVASLRPSDREIFVAQPRDGMTYDQIAVATGLSRKQVKRRMARALFEIGRHLKGKRRP